LGTADLIGLTTHPRDNPAVNFNQFTPTSSHIKPAMVIPLIAISVENRSKVEACNCITISTRNRSILQCLHPHAWFHLLVSIHSPAISSPYLSAQTNIDSLVSSVPSLLSHRTCMTRAVPHLGVVRVASSTNRTLLCRQQDHRFTLKPCPPHQPQYVYLAFRPLNKGNCPELRLRSYVGYTLPLLYPSDKYPAYEPENRYEGKYRITA
jgi:hypothetical protein